MKKWMPSTPSGRSVTAASFMIGMDEVLLASTHSVPAVTVPRV